MKCMILAGEVSGDIHGGHLVRELKKSLPDMEFIGMGGSQLEKEGVHLLYGLKDLAVMGLTEVIRKYFHFRRIFYHLARVLKKERPAALILIDYPGFNVRFARIAKKFGIPVIYYISPQIWAWAKWRRRIIARRVDKMFVIFPFEKSFYQGTGLNVEYVGHPLVDKLSQSSGEVPSSVKREGQKLVVGLLPGSRTHEVERLFPLMVEVAKILRQELPQIHFLASAVNESLHQMMKKEEKGLPLEVFKGKASEIMKRSNLVLVASGTATLESALLLTPMVIVYKVSFLTWLLARMLIRLPYIGLVNIVGEKKIVPEFIQFSAKAQAIADEVSSILKSPEKIERIKKELSLVKAAIGAKGASQRAAQGIVQYLNQIKAIKV